MRLPKVPKITEWREDPGITERTLAALVSDARTKVHVNKAADNPRINGMYVPDTDAIYLFKCKGKIPAVCVALEEAGHSLQRQAYIDNGDRAKRVREQLEAWDAQAPGLLDWYEDGRIYDNLKAEYPGAADDLDHVWDMRRESLDKLAWDTKGTTPEEMEAISRRKELAEEFLRSVDRYQTGNSFRTFPEVLDYLEKFAETKPQDQPVGQGKTTIVVVCKTGHHSTDKGLKVLRPEEQLPLDQMTVVIEMNPNARGLGDTKSDYPWMILRTDEMEVENSEDYLSW